MRIRLRTPRNLCKFAGWPSRAAACTRRHALLGAVLVALLAGGCASRSRNAVGEAQLEAAQTVAIQNVRTVAVTDLSALRSDYTALGERLALVEVSTPAQLAALRAAAPALDAQPDLARGMLVGVISQMGTSVDGRGGVELLDLRCVNADSMLAVRYRHGTYLPDGTATLSIGYVPTRARVTVVAVGTTRYYVEP